MSGGQRGDGPRKSACVDEKTPAAMSEVSRGRPPLDPTIKKRREGSTAVGLRPRKDMGHRSSTSTDTMLVQSKMFSLLKALFIIIAVFWARPLLKSMTLLFDKH